MYLLCLMNYLLWTKEIEYNKYSYNIHGYLKLFEKSQVLFLIDRL